VLSGSLFYLPNLFESCLVAGLRSSSTGTRPRRSDLCHFCFPFLVPSLTFFPCRNCSSSFVFPVGLASCSFPPRWEEKASSMFPVPPDSSLQCAFRGTEVRRRRRSRSPAHPRCRVYKRKKSLAPGGKESTTSTKRPAFPLASGLSKVYIPRAAHHWGVPSGIHLGLIINFDSSYSGPLFPSLYFLLSFFPQFLVKFLPFFPRAGSSSGTLRGGLFTR